MSDRSDFVSEARREYGEKYAREGQPLHDSASDEFKQGYRRGALGFGSNVMPSNFGRGRSERTEWECICGHVNKRYLVQCWMCNVRRELAAEAKETPDVESA